MNTQDNFKRGSTAAAVCRLLAYLVAVALLAGCSGKPPASGAGTDPSDKPGSSANSSSDQDKPYSLDEDGETPPPAEDVEFEEDQVPPAPEEIGAATLSPDAVASETVEDQGEGLPPIEPTVTTPVEPTVQTPAPEQQAQMERGFRVQIFAGGGRGDADQVAIQARTRTQDPVYVQFESPYYKVRVGDFQDRAKALEMRDRLRGYGYPQAWVVTTQVNVAASGP